MSQQQRREMNLRAVVVGFGEMGAHHTRALSGLSGVELVAIVDPRCAGEEWRGIRILAELDDAASEGLDIAVVATPTITHHELALQLCDLGIHALIEKPLAADWQTCLAIDDAFNSAGLIGCVGQIERFNPAIRGMKDRIEAGLLGDAYQVATRRQGPHPTGVKDVGVVMDLATHDLDLTSWVTGQAYDSVVALGSRNSGDSREDLVIITGQLGGGTLTSHLVNWVSPLKERVVVITGTNGSLVADTLSSDLFFHKNGVAPVQWEAVAAFRGVVQGDVIRYALRKREPLEVELEAFRDVVLGRRTDVVTMRDAAQTVRVAEAALTSMHNDGEPARC